MKRIKALLCALLTIMVAVPAMVTPLFSYYAAAGDTVYFQSPGSFSNPTCYAWTDSGGNGNQNGAWPGIAMTWVSGNIYKYTLPADYSNLIFSDSGSSQTGDLTFQGADMMYVYSSSSWKQYTGSEEPEPTNPTGPADPNPPEENIIPNPSFETEGGWNFLSNMARSSDKAKTGSFSAKSTVRNRSITLASSNSISVTPHTDYLFSAAIYRTDNSAWAYIDMNDMAGELQLQDTSAPGSWQYVSGVWNSGSNTSVQVRAVVEPDYHNTTPEYNGITGDIWFDDISLVPITYDSYSETPPQLSAAAKSYTIQNSQIKVTIKTDGNQEYIAELINKQNNINWIDTASAVPVVNTISGNTVNWQISDTMVDNTNPLTGTGPDTCHTITVTYTSSAPNLTLKSYWQVYPTGPLYHYSEIINHSGGNISIKSNDVRSGDVLLTIPNNVTVHRFNRSRFNNGFDGYFTTGIFQNAVTKNLFLKNTVENSWLVSSGSLPFELLHAKDGHGLYVGYEWSYGDMLMRTQNNSNKLRFTANMGYSAETVQRQNGETYLVPPVFYGAYSGSVDDGSNNMKRWFYNHLMTASLRENANEPLIELHLPLFEESNLTGYLQNNNLEQWGVELTKMDYWWTVPDGNFNSYLEQQWEPYPSRWPNGMTYGKLVKQYYPSLKTSLYMCDTYQGVDIGTKTGQQAQINALATRMDNWKIDYWRSDFDIMKPNSYTNHEGLMYILDTLIDRDSNFRYEHCSAGGSLKDFSTLKRMTFMTMEDSGGALNHRMAFYSNSYMINPVQLKFDLGYDWTSNEDANYIHSNPEEWTYYNLRTGMMGAMMVSNVSGYLTDMQRKAAIESWNLYKTKQREILRGANVYHILPMPDGINWDGMQFYNPDIEKGSVFLFRNRNTGGTDGANKMIKLDGLEPTANYTLTFEDRTSLNTAKTGRELMETGIYVTGMTSVYDSEIIWIEKVGGPTPTDPATEPTTETQPTLSYILGDCNMDGAVNIKDATFIQRAIAELYAISDLEKAIGDVNGDGNLNIRDVTIIQRYIAGSTDVPANIGKPVLIP